MLPLWQKKESRLCSVFFIINGPKNSSYETELLFWLLCIQFIAQIMSVSIAPFHRNRNTYFFCKHKYITSFSSENLIHIQLLHMMVGGVEQLQAVLLLRRLGGGLSARRTGFPPRSFCVRFLADKLEIGQVFLQVLWFPPVFYTHNSLLCHWHYTIIAIQGSVK